jgi:hypothetical protein
LSSKVPRLAVGPDDGPTSLTAACYDLRASVTIAGTSHPGDRELLFMTNSIQEKPRKRARFWRLMIAGCTVVALALVAFGVSVFISAHSNQKRLDAILARLDSTDPNWRLHDLDKDMIPLADGRNSALVVQRILNTRPPGAWPSIAVENAIDSQGVTVRLPPPEAAKLLKDDLARSPETIALVRRLASLPQGYRKIDWPPDGVSGLLPAMQQTRELARLGYYDASLRANEKDFDGALESCRAILCVGRANEPCCTLIQLLVRIAIDSVCIGQVERVLALGEPSEASLEATQKLLEDELAQPLFRQSLRGERALSYWLMETTYKGHPGQVILMNIGAAWTAKTDLANKITLILQSPFGGSLEANEALCLESLTELMEVSKKPEAEQDAAFDKVDALSKDWRQPSLFRMMLPSLLKVREAYQRSQARMRSAVAAIAAERYRRKHGAWPARLEQLAPAELKEIPVDPFDLKPLRMRRVDDGLIIYSIGADKVDDGGQVISVTGLPADTGFRLWDLNKRGQKYVPEPVEPEPDN